MLHVIACIRIANNYMFLIFLEDDTVLSRDDLLGIYFLFMCCHMHIDVVLVVKILLLTLYTPWSEC